MSSRFGWLIFKVNAQSEEAAREEAVVFASDHDFSMNGREMPMSVEDEREELMPPASESSGAGAWLVKVQREGFLNDNGNEFDSMYEGTEIEFVSRLPWEYPDMEEKGVNWEGLRKAVLEKEDFNQSTEMGGSKKKRKI